MAEQEGEAAKAAEVAAELAGMDEQMMDVQEKFASLQRFEARACCVHVGHAKYWEFWTGHKRIDALRAPHIYVLSVFVMS